MLIFISVILFIFCLLLIAILGYVLYKSYHLARTVMILEDDLSEAIEKLNSAEETMNNLLNMRLFFDSPEVKNAVQACLDEVKLTKFEINKLAQKFVERSKQKYVVEEIEEEELTQEQFLKNKEKLLRIDNEN
jgi:hypothetical protein